VQHSAMPSAGCRVASIALLPADATNLFFHQVALAMLRT
jgi:hypothetical protein